MFKNNVLSTISSALVVLVLTSAAVAAPYTDLITALEGGDTNVAADLLRQGVGLRARTESGATPLHVAAAFGYPEIVRMLLETGADAGERGPNGNTPLLYAAQEGHAEVVRVLLQAGADPGHENDFGMTAAGLALGWGHRDVTAELGETALAGDEDSRAPYWLWAAGLLAAAGIGSVELRRRYAGPWSARGRRRNCCKQAA